MNNLRGILPKTIAISRQKTLNFNRNVRLISSQRSEPPFSIRSSRAHQILTPNSQSVVLHNCPCRGVATELENRESFDLSQEDFEAYSVETLKHLTENFAKLVRERSEILSTRRCPPNIVYRVRQKGHVSDDDKFSFFRFHFAIPAWITNRRLGRRLWHVFDT